MGGSNAADSTNRNTIEFMIVNTSDINMTCRKADDARVFASNSTVGTAIKVEIVKALEGTRQMVEPGIVDV